MVRRRRTERAKRAEQARPKPPAGYPGTSDEVPVGLTLAEVQGIYGQVFDGVANGTKGVYQKHLSYFGRWCQGRGIKRSQVETDHVTVYLREMREARSLSVSSLGCAAAAIKKALEWDGRGGAVDWDDIGDRLRGYRRRDRQQPAAVDGITREYFELLEAAAWLPMVGEWPEKTARRATAVVALVAVMRDSLLRRSEAAALRWGDIRVERTPGHIYASVKIPFSKTDQYGSGAVGYLHIDTMVKLQEMAAAWGMDPSDGDRLVFGIGESQVARRIKAACERAALPGRFSGHSCRVGMALDLATNNTPLVGVMQSGRWRIPETVMRYIKSIAVRNGAVARWHRCGDGVPDPKPAPKERIEEV